MNQSESGYFAYDAPDGAEFPEHVVTVVRLRVGRFWDAPFWDDSGHLSDEYTDIEHWLGISEALFEDAVGWNFSAHEYLDGPQSLGEERDRIVRERHELLERLRVEVRDGVQVDESDAGGLD